MKRFLVFLLLPLVGACGSLEDPRQHAPAIADWLAASVQLFSERDGGQRRFGSGVVVAMDDDGRALVATAGHVLRPDSDEKVYAIDPATSEPKAAEILAVNGTTDVAILRVPALNGRPAPLQTSARLGDDVWVVSFPWGRRGTLVNGIVSQIAPDGTPASIPIEGPVSLIDAAVSYGTSGGGVFDGQSGTLIGIVRGYRTARLSIPGAQSAALEFPIAGETTVVATSTILCLFAQAKLDHLLEDTGGWDAATARCIESEGERADASS